MPRIEAWFTLEGEPAEPPPEIMEWVEAKVRALGLRGPWRRTVWLPDVTAGPFWP